MEKIYGTWCYAEGEVDFFMSSDGIEFVFHGEDENGFQLFRNTADTSADYVEIESLIDNGTGNPPLLPVVLATFRANGFDSLDDLAVSCEHAYKLGLNPLPRIREFLKYLPLSVNFTFRGSFFEAAPRSATLSISLDSDTGAVSISLIDQYFHDGKNCWMDIRLNADTPILE